jgi:hypothetical protein
MGEHPAKTKSKTGVEGDIAKKGVFRRGVSTMIGKGVSSFQLNEITPTFSP